MHDSTDCPICRGLPVGGSFSDDEFFQFLNACRAELESRQAAFVATLDPQAQWSYDLDSGRLRVGAADFPITAIGTHNPDRQTWLWAWANESFPDAARDASAAIRSLFELTGFRVFADPGIGASSGDAQDLSACAIHTLGAIGLFRCPGNEATLYLAVHG